MEIRPRSAPISSADAGSPGRTRHRLAVLRDHHAIRIEMVEHGKTPLLATALKLKERRTECSNLSRAASIH